MYMLLIKFNEDSWRIDVKGTLQYVSAMAEAYKENNIEYVIAQEIEDN